MKSLSVWLHTEIFFFVYWYILSSYGKVKWEGALSVPLLVVAAVAVEVDPRAWGGCSLTFRCCWFWGCYVTKFAPHNALKLIA